jgi:hypothetical protein
MFGTVIGAIIGSKIDRADGEGGVKGALLGALAPALVKRVLPLAILAGGALLVKNALDARKTPEPVA